MWSGYLLPYLEQSNLFESIEIAGPWTLSDPSTPENNVAALSTMIELLQCPSGGLPAAQLDPLCNFRRVPCSYLACASGSSERESGDFPWCGMNAWVDPVSGVPYPPSDGVFFMDSRTRAADIQDGLSHTILLGETIPDQQISGQDYGGNEQKIDHWYIASPELFDYEYLRVYRSAENSECLGSTACPINAAEAESCTRGDRWALRGQDA